MADLILPARAQVRPDAAPAAPSRRAFFKRAGAGLGTLALAGTVAATASGCDGNSPGSGTVVLDFSNDFGVLNYAYALEQLEYAFYLRVTQTAYFQGAPSAEQQILDDLRKHEKVHVDFLAAAIPALGGTLIGNLEFDFGQINFSSRASVLEAARLFEDTGVSAYNGAGQYLRNPDLLTIAGKIVSVEARHASAIRDILQPGTNAFAGDDVVSVQGALDVSAMPAQVVSGIAPFVRGRVEVRNVPT
ncbi:MAG: ferritin-like domain-containing protein [Rubricoccaceae bacterium]